MQKKILQKSYIGDNKLRKWKCEEDICYAGLFHSIYGNEYFQQETESNRDVIKDPIMDFKSGIKLVAPKTFKPSGAN